jgi:integrase
MIKQTKELPFKDWSEDLRIRWELAFAKGGFLDEDGPGAHLKPATRAMWRSACGRFLRFRQLLMGEPFPTLQESVINPDVLSAYVDYRWPSYYERSVASELRQLRHAFRLIFPGLDLGWLLKASKRIASLAPPKAKKHHLVTSERLYLLGLELMDGAIELSNATGQVSKACALQYRDGLIILLLALIPLRRRTLTALRVGKQLVRAGNAWMLDIPREDTKTDEPLEFLLCETLSRRIDLYLERFRGRIPNSAKHNGLWVSNKGNPMAGGTIYDMVIRRTRKALGFGVTLHRFRHAALTFWSIHDPANIRAGKNLLGHRSFGTTEEFYIIAQSRVAGRILADAWQRFAVANASRL